MTSLIFGAMIHIKSLGHSRYLIKISGINEFGPITFVRLISLSLSSSTIYIVNSQSSKTGIWFVCVLFLSFGKV
jgi:hypothetical protein